ncbi:M28 family metallopeptidase [Endozoicomonas ascidiicola]|uniref:M28 family metallopeptidase n=1 Tax=Endozoicomonas ascidiicola TaxID=1698521 RepID=UPI000831AADA|nr:M20/M25/M40 family metallo-hydrolase [Endozoicomonas ascidiicola]
MNTADVVSSQREGFLTDFDIEQQSQPAENSAGWRGWFICNAKSNKGKLLLGGLVLFSAGIVGAVIALPVALAGRTVAPLQTLPPPYLQRADNGSDVTLPITMDSSMFSEVSATTAPISIGAHPYFQGYIESQVNQANLKKELAELLAIGSRSSFCDANSNGFLKASDWLKTKLSGLDVAVTKNDFSYHDNYHGSQLRSSCSGDQVQTSSNLFAMVPGQSTECVVVGAHLDTVTNTVGANDNGSGVVALLEMIRILKQENVEPRHSIVFAFWGAEEAGTTLLGSGAFLNGNNSQVTLANLSSTAGMDNNGPFSIKGYINLDMIAGNVAGKEGIVISDPDSQTGFWEYLPYKFFPRIAEGTRNISRLFMDYFSERNIPFTKTKMYRVGDHASFQDKSIPSVMLYTGYDRCYHKTCDDGSNVDFAKLQLCTKAALNVTVELAMGRRGCCHFNRLIRLA